MKNKFLVSASSLLLALSTFPLFHLSNNEVVEVTADSSTYWSSISSETISTGGKTLFDAITPIIANHTVLSYNSLQNKYYYTDYVKGKSQVIYDMYGGQQYYLSETASTATSVGQGYNKEHSIPQSWFNGKESGHPGYSDLMHVVPADTYSNTQRSSYMFGEVDKATFTYNLPEQKDGSGNVCQTAGVVKLGSYKKIYGIDANDSAVFEPDDQYKGDFARICLYFATCYPGDATYNATSRKFFSSSFPYLTTYGLTLCLKWHYQDPVSSKETYRNNQVESQQGNRNPFVDHPDWVSSIWDKDHLLIDHLTVDNPKTEYENGEAFVKPTITAQLKDGNTKDVTSSAYCDGFDSSIGGNKTIKVHYAGHFVNYSIYVKPDENRVLEKLELQKTPDKTFFYQGDSLDLTGLELKATYSDKSVDILTSDDINVTGFDSSNPGACQLTFSYTYKTVTMSINFTVIIGKRSDPPAPTPTSGGCGGDVATSSVILSSIALSAIALVVITSYIKKKKTK